MEMAQKITVLLVDDIDGSEAGETISFAWTALVTRST
jgi:hypothetical protein